MGEVRRGGKQQAEQIMLVGTSTMKINLLSGGRRLSAQQRAKTKDNLGRLPRSQSALDRKSVVPKFLHKPSGRK